VVLITIDTLRADALGVYGNPKGTSPWTDRLAQAGVLFESARAHNVLTLPSHANILSGRYPFEHGVRDNAGFRFPQEMETLTTLMSVAGYRTGAFVSGAPLLSRFGLGRGFEVYDDRFADKSAPEAFAVAERAAPETVAAALDWLRADGTRPHFLWLHLYDPHAPFRPAKPYASRFRGEPYLGEVAATDDALRPLIEPLLEAGADGRTLVVFTGDHGESLGEHGELTHGLFGYEATLRVPLVLFAPRILEPRVVTEEVRHVDLLPTILDALQLPIPDGLSGRSLLPAAAGRAPGANPEATYFEALSGQLVRGWAPLYGVVEGGMKYVDLPLPELYDLREDAAELHNLARDRPGVVAALSRSLERFRSRDPGVTVVQEDLETRQRLAALGYVTAATVPEKSEYTAEDDPKRLVELDAMLQRVLSLHREGKLVRALELCEELVARRPGMAVSHAQLAMLHARLGQLDEAIVAASEAVALNPADVMPVVLLADQLSDAGRPREAAQLLEPYAGRPDADLQVLTTQGAVLAQLGEVEAALTAFGRVRELDPGDTMILVKMAMVHLTAGAYDAASELLEEALARDPGLALAHQQLGLIAVQQGKDAEAEGHFRKALSFDRNEVDALLNLGMLLVRQGRRGDARPLLERFVRLAPRPLFQRQVEGVEQWLARVPRDPPASGR